MVRSNKKTGAIPGVNASCETNIQPGMATSSENIVSQLWQSLGINELANGGVEAKEATLQYIKNVLLDSLPDADNFNYEYCWQAARLGAAGFFWGYREALLVTVNQTVNR